MKQRPAYLVLADGLVLPGHRLGADATAVGEVVFTTGMTGYQEVLTDPSYHGQIVTMTAAQIGNTGVNRDDDESVNHRPRAQGFVINDESPLTSNYRSEEHLDAYLARHGVAAIAGIDTRTLTRHLRDHGSQNGAIGDDPAQLLAAARSARSMAGLDLVREVTPEAPYPFDEGLGGWSLRPRVEPTRHVVAIDCGLKRNILRCLVDAGCRVTVVPATFSAEQILALSPDGVFLSNGPGDPAPVTYLIETVKALLGKKPIFGICLGHQILALALGASTYKLKFGHRGCNQPVIDLTTQRVEITTQNHGFAVDLHSLAGKAETTHLHLNDRTSEGLAVPALKAFSVQYHPEAAAGPHDSMYLFDRFVGLMN